MQPGTNTELENVLSAPIPRVKYRAFISYAHADDQPQTGMWATWLQKKLQDYQIPERVSSLLEAENPGCGNSLHPIFRDKTAMGGAADLSKEIRSALDDSMYLIVICSPRAALSEYVNMEVDHFIRSGKTDKILPIVILGTPCASVDSRLREDPEDSRSLECFPPALLEVVKSREPMWIDFRLSSGHRAGSSDAITLDLLKSRGVSRRAAKIQVQEYASVRNTSFLRLVAGVTGLPLTLLLNTSAERKSKRRMRIVALSFLALSLVAYSIYQHTASLVKEKNKVTTEALSAHYLSRLAHIENDSKGARRLALAGWPRHLDDSIPRLPEAEAWLQQLVTSMMKEIHIGPFPSDIIGWKIGPIGRYIALWFEDGSLSIYNLARKTEITMTTNENVVSGVIFDSDEAAITVWRKKDTHIERFSTSEGTVLARKNIKANPRKIISIYSGQKLGVLLGQKVIVINRDALENELILQPTDGNYIMSLVTDPQGTRALLWTVNTAKKIKDWTHGTVSLYSLASGKLIEKVPHSDMLRGAVVSADGDRFATLASDGTAYILNASDGTLSKPLKHEGSIVGGTFSGDSSMLVTWSRDNTAKVWQSDTGFLIATLEYHSSTVTGASFNSDESELLTYSSDGSAMIWDVESWNTRQPLQGHVEGIVTAKWSPDDSRIMTLDREDAMIQWLSTDGTQVLEHRGTTAYQQVFSAFFDDSGEALVVQLWNASSGATSIVEYDRTGRTLRSHVFQGRQLSGVVPFPNGEGYASPSGKNKLSIWNPPRPIFKRVLPKLDFGRHNLRKSPERLVADWTKSSSQVTVYDPETGKAKYKFNANGGALSHIESFPKGSFPTFPDGMLVTVTNTTVELRDLSNGLLVETISGFDGEVVSLQESNSGAFLVLTSEDNAVYLWSFADRKLLRVTDRSDTGAIKSTTFDMSDQFLLIQDISRDGILHSLFDLSSMKIIGQYRESSNRASVVAFSSDSKQLLIVPEHDEPILMSTVDGKQIAANPDLYGMSAIQWRSDIALSMASGQGEAVLLAGPDFETMQRFVHDGFDSLYSQDVSPVSRTGPRFSNDGGWYVSNSGNSVTVWQTSHGQILHRITDLDSPVVQALFTPNKDRLLVVTESGSVSLWSMETGAMLAVLAHDWPRAINIEFSEDGELLLVGFLGRQSARVYDLDLGVVVLEFGGGESVADVLFAENSTNIIYRTYEGLLEVWESPKLEGASFVELLCADIKDEPVPLVIRGFSEPFQAPICENTE